MKTKITETHVNRCECEFVLPDGDIINESYVAPTCGGYIRFKDGAQACGLFSKRGWTLEWDPKTHPTLATLIRELWKDKRRKLLKHYEKHGYCL